MVWLDNIRATLIGLLTGSWEGQEGPSRHIASPDWPWLVAGVLLCASFVLLLLLARACA
jgi:hypothetical protein